MVSQAEFCKQRQEKNQGGLKAGELEHQDGKGKEGLGKLGQFQNELI